MVVMTTLQTQPAFVWHIMRRVVTVSIELVTLLTLEGAAELRELVMAVADAPTAERTADVVCGQTHACIIGSFPRAIHAAHSAVELTFALTRGAVHVANCVARCVQMVEGGAWRATVFVGPDMHVCDCDGDDDAGALFRCRAVHCPRCIMLGWV